MKIRIFLNGSLMENVIIHSSNIEYIHTVTPAGIDKRTQRPSTEFRINFHFLSSTVISVALPNKDLLIDNFAELLRFKCASNELVNLEQLIMKVIKTE